MFFYKLEILYYDRYEFSERKEVNKTSELKQFYICDYWHLLDKGFEFQVDVCNGYHDILMMSLILTDVANLHIHGAD